VVRQGVIEDYKIEWVSEDPAHELMMGLERLMKPLILFVGSQLH
jgi:hypothetical protein